jgi:hypothetical protein
METRWRRDWLNYAIVLVLLMLIMACVLWFVVGQPTGSPAHFRNINNHL